MLSQTAEHALRAAACLARDPSASMTQHQVAAATAIPPVYLYKVLQILARAGLLRSIRGQRGGYQLARPPEAITALEIVLATSTRRPVRDPTAEYVTATLNRALAGITLADLAVQDAAASLKQSPLPFPQSAIHDPHSAIADDWAVWNARAG